MRKNQPPAVVMDGVRVVWGRPRVLFRLADRWGCAKVARLHLAAAAVL